ncbi:penicillin-binding protein 2 [Parvibaculum sp.]|jgi:cell division protein FtsI (penicillin-binding protein 3)|uniref:peptidoglycan D,D-transpeptidase FtsI family protein n=1 Tax=Parvibaculum sp. TaxID=2024848 RepID=UPI001B246CE0|nr:penicillin-binding protein 2 [Parvibaculum sp.]MBO6679736.1 penicillin-binding protein 2 [Parvibaculum sp.]MBO6683603.1 penicillin-binding protein 2 [Parvibaculum sp.]MBO6906333.1 penicillin-binding protein 2 [Parvibaculum sp.]
MIGRNNSTPYGGRYLPPGHDAISMPRAPRQGAGRTPSQRRIFLSLAVFAACFTLVGARLVGLAIMGGGGEGAAVVASAATQVHRPDIVDRNGEVMATDIATASLFADARYVIDPAETARQLTGVLPDLDLADTTEKLSSGRAFIWLKRDLTPKQQYAVHYLGLPGLDFRSEQKRVYPNGKTGSNVLGMVDIDNRGIAGIERYMDSRLAQEGAAGAPRFDRNTTVMLSIDLHVQHALRDELEKAMVEFSAMAAAGVIMDVHTGEVVAMSSLPDFDPNDPMASPDENRFNRATLGVYEMGSVFKAVTLAAALDSGKVNLDGRFDATKPLKVARFTIHDYHAENRWLTVPEVFIHSSNIGTAKIALQLGGEEHREYLRRFGLLSRPEIELPEAGAPLTPARWGEIATITTSYGHGIAVTPLQVASAVSTIVNGGFKVQPTFMRRNEAALGERVISADTSATMRGLLRLVVMEGTGRKADVAGYPVMGKTGTAEKPVNGGYSRTKLITSFISAFPANDPRYAMIVMFDEPKATKETYGYATAGWNAAPVTSRVVSRVAPLLGLRPATKPHENEMMREAKLVSYETLSGQ